VGHAAGSEKPASASDIVGCTLVVAHFWSTSVSAYSDKIGSPMGPNAKRWACPACYRTLFGTEND